MLQSGYSTKDDVLIKRATSEVGDSEGEGGGVVERETCGLPSTEDRWTRWWGVLILINMRIVMGVL